MQRIHRALLRVLVRVAWAAIAVGVGTSLGLALRSSPSPPSTIMALVASAVFVGVLQQTLP